MEDRILAAFPFTSVDSAADTTVGIFAVCDGHGGSFVSQYITESMPQVIRKVMAEALLTVTSSGASTPTINSLSSQVLEDVLKESCRRLEKQLQDLPRLTVDIKAVKGTTHDERTDQPLNPKPADSSGSTGLFRIILDLNHAQ